MGLKFEDLGIVGRDANSDERDCRSQTRAMAKEKVGKSDVRKGNKYGINERKPVALRL